jgi:hypothetical protein
LGRNPVGIFLREKCPNSSAGFQPAAAPANRDALKIGEHSADGKSAIQQTASLRYELLSSIVWPKQ